MPLDRGDHAVMLLPRLADTNRFLGRGGAVEGLAQPGVIVQQPAETGHKASVPSRRSVRGPGGWRAPPRPRPPAPSPRRNGPAPPRDRRAGRACGSWPPAGRCRHGPSARSGRPCASRPRHRGDLCAAVWMEPDETLAGEPCQNPAQGGTRALDASTAPPGRDRHRARARSRGSARSGRHGRCRWRPTAPASSRPVATPCRACTGMRCDSERQTGLGAPPPRPPEYLCQDDGERAGRGEPGRGAPTVDGGARTTRNRRPHPRMPRRSKETRAATSRAPLSCLRSAGGVGRPGCGRRSRGSARHRHR